MDEITNREIFGKSEIKWGYNQNDGLNRLEQRLIDSYVSPLPRDAKLMEAGCGAGRICERLSDMGFERIDAFDFLEEVIQRAKQRGSAVNYFAADATNLDMIADNSYDCVLYLQRLIGFIPVKQMDAALSESCRVCKPGGIAVFSFLNYGGRWFNRPLSGILTVARRLQGEKHLSPRQFPWLKLKGKPNWRLLQKGQATNYWFTRDEVRDKLAKAGYEVLEMFTGKEPPKEGSILYVACRKRDNHA